ncbi:hypothetical protein Fleli_2670 [Bernardetia litoralis DSM 6794]|uniref:Lipoprotein n=1 Tax=Bernardetia litoralis (strain ATCC 23117 / DSM 6794 / NBRC 15988 / NCIMB 1366 / Fx l1 / Sio-4) TaxID=880071 RepID=I4AM42_BERLS|nr:hypothetical protein [Bernardetia litoralis]AFM05027.1 hypothetical protein Fleli_2670 [Bernardetia litoralis DSM 6794]
MKIQYHYFYHLIRKNIFFLLIICSIFLFNGTLTSCAGNKSSNQASEQEAGKKKKKKAKKCKEEGCRVRMSHYHEGSEFKGKRGNIFIRLFTPKESKYGQGRHRNNGWKSGKK